MGSDALDVRDYEAPLALLALDHADLALGDFEPPVGTERLREFWERHWADRFPTHPEEDPLHPTRLLRLGGPRGQAPRRSDDTDPCAAPARYGTPDDRCEIVAKIITAQPNPRDRIALMLLFRLALRKSELAAIQFKHFGHDRKRLRVYGKGGTIIPVPVPDFIRQEIAAFMALERPKPSDYLLYPQKRTGHSGRWNREVEA